MPRLRLVLLLLALLPLGSRAAAPPPSVDTLKAHLARPGLPDSIRVSIYAHLLRGLLRTDQVAARRYGEQGLALARRIGARATEMRLLNNLAAVSYASSDLLAAQRYFEQLAAGAHQLGNCELEGNAYLGLGNVMGALDEVARAMGYYEQAQTVYAACDPPALTGRALVLNNIGLNYINTRQYAKAARPVRQAAALVGHFQHPWLEASLMVNLGSLQQAEGHPDSAVTTWQQALVLGRRLDDPTSQAAALGHLAEQRLPRDPAGALALVREALALARAAEDPDQVAGNLRLQATILSRLGQARPAYDSLDRFVTLRDSLAGRALREAIARQQVRFDVAQQKVRIRQLGQQQRISRLRAEREQARAQLYGLVAGGLLLIVVLGAALVALLVRSRRRLQASEAALREANGTKEELMRIIGHDLRAPVASFQQITPLLPSLLGPGTPATAGQLIRTLDHGAQQLGALVDNLLHWSRARSGLVSHNPTAVPVALAVTSSVQLYGGAAGVKGVQLETDVPADLYVWADLDLLGTVLRNLLGNAVKFTPAGGTVRVAAARTPAGRVEVSVTDSGVGIAPDKLATLLAPDRVVPTRGTAGEPGTGLGLALCVRFVRLLGGELAVSSGPGAGARFWFTLPVPQLVTFPGPGQGVAAG